MQNQNQLKNILKNNRAFSLGEIMIVLVIIGGLMAVILPKIKDGGDRSKVSNTRLKMSDITTRINEYVAECGKLPNSLSFITEDSSDCKNWTSNSNLKSLLKDAWVNDFEYSTAGSGYILKSLGADKKEGGIDFAKDIVSDESVGEE